MTLIIPITTLDAGVVKTTDVYPAVDVTDTAQAPFGTTKKYTIGQLATYVLSLGGYLYLAPCRVATVADLGAAYDNGPLNDGVSSTLTNSGTKTALLIDGIVMAVGDRVLVKNQATTFQNGVYTVTVVGSATVNWVMTRAKDWDHSAQMFNDQIIQVGVGTMNNNTVWLSQLTAPVTVGTSPIGFTTFAMPTVPVVVGQGGTGLTSLTPYALIAGGTTATGAMQQVTALGTAGQVLTSNGPGALPTFQAAGGGGVTAAQVQKNVFNYVLAGGAVDAYTVTLSPAPASITGGLSIWMVANNTNTGPATLDINGFGPIGLQDINGNNLSAGQILGGGTYQIIVDFSGGFAVVQSASGAGGGSGTVNTGSINQLAWYAANGTAVSGLSAGAVTDGYLSLVASVPTWNAILPVNQVITQVFTSSGTYTPTAGMKYCVIECIGGGAGGGGTANTAAVYQASAGGGGGGGYSRKTVSAATIGVSQVVTVGALGAGGAVGNNNGVAGGDTSVGAICIAKGGSPGTGSNGTASGQGGVGAVAGTGDVTIVGNGGISGGVASLITCTVFIGLGAAGPLGGSPGLQLIPGNTTNGTSATNYGGGGNGGYTIAANGATSGGNGSKGLVIITEYVSA